MNPYTQPITQLSPKDLELANHYTSDPYDRNNSKPLVILSPSRPGGTINLDFYLILRICIFLFHVYPMFDNLGIDKEYQEYIRIDPLEN